MSDYWDKCEPIVMQSRIKIPYSWQAGETASYFLTRLREEGKIGGRRCPECNQVLVPPRKSCPFCFVETAEWVEVSGEGEVVTFTIVKRDTPIQPRKAPFAYAVIRLDGADTGLVHLLGDIEPDRIKEGMRVKACWAKERKGALLDIEYFRPVKD